MSVRSENGKALLGVSPWINNHFRQTGAEILPQDLLGIPSEATTKKSAIDGMSKLQSRMDVRFN